MTSFQKRFSQAKDLSGLRWIDIAKRSGLDKASISQYKNGVHIPEPDALFRIAYVLDVSAEWLMGGNVPMEPESAIIQKYHQLNDEGRKVLEQTLNDLLKMYRL